MVNIFDSLLVVFGSIWCPSNLRNTAKMFISMQVSICGFDMKDHILVEADVRSQFVQLGPNLS